MFGDKCCTFILNNTAPDGMLTKAIHRLEALAKHQKSMSGIYNLFSTLLQNWFGEWKGVFLSILMPIAVMVAIFVLCGCCCIPCIRHLC